MELRIGWNAHNDIGINLERIAKRILCQGKLDGADNTIYCADLIEGSTFAEVMVCLLRHKKGYNINEKYDNFIELIAPIFGKGVDEIGPEKSQELLDKFKDLIESE